jgi:hypothetical protein
VAPKYPRASSGRVADCLVTSRAAPSLARPRQRMPRHRESARPGDILLGPQRNDASRQASETLWSLYHDRPGLVQRGGACLRNRKAGGIGVRRSDHKTDDEALRALKRERVSPTGAKIAQTGLDRLARDEAGGAGGSAAPFLSSSGGAAHYLAFFRKSMFNPPDSNGLTATLKSL